MRSALLFVVIFIVTSFGVMLSQQPVLPAGINITGISNLSFSNYEVIGYPGSNTSVNFTMQLEQGSGNATYLLVVNYGQLLSNGIYARFDNSSGTPTFNGTLNMTIGNSTNPGYYNITPATYGADPALNLSNITLVVLPKSAEPTTASVTTGIGSENRTANAPVSSTVAQSSPTSSQSTTIQALGPGKGSESTSRNVLISAIAIIILVIIAIFLVAKLRKG